MVCFSIHSTTVQYNGLESSYAYIVYFYISRRVGANALISSSGSSTDEGQDYEFATHVVKVKRSGQGITLSKNLQFTIQVYLLKLDEYYKTYFLNFSVIDVKSLWDMDSQEGSKMPFAVGSKFDHLSPEHGNNMQKKVYLLSSINCMTYLCLH